MEQKKQYVFIEVLRVIACFLVIVNHTNSRLFYGFGPSPTWFASITYMLISKMAVPIFVMISGFTMLHKKDSYQKSFQRLLRVVITLVLFSFVYYALLLTKGAIEVISLSQFVTSVLQGPLNLAYWYLYLYIGILIMMPFLQKLAAGLEKKDCEILILLSLVVYGVVPILEHVFPAVTYSKLVDMSLFSSYIGMLFIGYYFRKYVTPSKKLLVLSIAGFAACIAFNVIMTYREYLIFGFPNFLFFENRVLFPVVLQGACCFYLVMHFAWEGKGAKLITTIGGCTFGIFLVSDALIEYVTPGIYEALQGMGLHAMITMVLWELIIFIIGLGMTLVMKQIPGLKKLL